MDIFHDGEPVTHQRPDSISEYFPCFHWRKVHRNLVLPYYQQFRQPLADYAVKHWNENHSEDEQVVELRLICYLDEIGPNYNATDRYSQVWGHVVLENDIGNTLDDLLKKSSRGGSILP